MEARTWCAHGPHTSSNPNRIMPRLPDFRTRLADLPDDVTAADLQPLAIELVERCSVESYPKMSIAAALRHARKVAPKSTVSLLGELVDSVQAQQEEADQPRLEAVVEGFIGLGEASRRLKVSAKKLKERVREVKYRRLYGWPWWDGHQWWFSPAALDPKQRAAQMATLPYDEPRAYVDVLPSWCESVEGKTPADAA